MSSTSEARLHKALINIALLTKSTVRKTKQYLLYAIAKRFADDQQVQRYYRLYKKYTSHVTQGVSLSAEERKQKGIDIEQARLNIIALEKPMYRRTGVNHLTEQYSFIKLKKCLRSSEATVTLDRIEAYDKNKKSIVFYYALIVTHENPTPKLIILSHGKLLEDLYAKAYKTAILGKSIDTVSYGRFWRPIANYLKAQKVKRVFVSPDGVYHLINLNSLYNPQNVTYAKDELDIRTVTTLRDLIKTRQQKSVSSEQVVNEAILVGRPRYDLPIASIQAKEQTFRAAMLPHTEVVGTQLPPTTNRLLKQGKAYLRSGWADLPGTEAEVKAIAQVIAEKGSIQTKIYLGSNALELMVKHVRHPKLLHIATHGFFIENFKAPIKVQKEEVVFDNFSRGGSKKETATQIAKIIREEPLLRSGIVLAGVSSYEKASLKPNIEDGVLTAYEAAQMNLQGTELVVLSACETGLGEAINGEGVYGLQQGFMVAGAKNILLSLWKVDDGATKLLMSKFYKEWIGRGKSKRKAFATAQMYLMKYKKNGQNIYASPYYWGAFQLIGVE